MFVKLDGISVFLLRVTEKLALNVVPFRCFKDRLRANPFVDKERHRLNSKRLAFLTFICPLQPGLGIQRISELLDLCIGECSFFCYT